MCGIIAEAPSIMYMISAEKILMPVRISRSGFQRQGMGRVTEREICSSYKHAKYKNRQIGILAELNSMDWIEVAGILIRNGEKIPHETIIRMCRKLDALEKQIAEKEREYKRIAGFMKGVQADAGGTDIRQFI